MQKERLYLFDTTLRDGAQTPGVDFTLADKRAIAALLDELGIDYVEGGYPGANPTDTQFFAEDLNLRATFTAFGMVRRPGRSAANDPGLADLLNARAKAVCFVAKSWDYHVRVALNTTLEENLAAVRDSVRAAKAKGREVLLDCEHFFDGYKANPQYALAVAKAAYAEGARWVVLCDTNGGTLPHEVERIVSEVVQVIPGGHVGIHAHNDTEQAVANSLAAVRAGARQIQGTLNGLGERCGNANLVSIIPTLKLKPEFADRFEINVSDAQLKALRHASRTLDAMLNRAPNRHAPYVGDSAFATKAGIHASAILKEPKTYEHVPPEAVGNLLEYYGVPVDREYDTPLTDVFDALLRGDKVIVALNANEIWEPQAGPDGQPLELPVAGHAVWVTGMHQDDDGQWTVVLNDTGTPGGRQETVSLPDFMNAWDDFGRYAVMTQAAEENPYVA